MFQREHACLRGLSPGSAAAPPASRGSGASTAAAPPAFSRCAGTDSQYCCSPAGLPSGPDSPAVGTQWAQFPRRRNQGLSAACYRAMGPGGGRHSRSAATRRAPRIPTGLARLLRPRVGWLPRLSWVGGCRFSCPTPSPLVVRYPIPERAHPDPQAHARARAPWLDTTDTFLSPPIPPSFAALAGR